MEKENISLGKKFSPLFQRTDRDSSLPITNTMGLLLGYEIIHKNLFQSNLIQKWGEQTYSKSQFGGGQIS